MSLVKSVCASKLLMAYFLGATVMVLIIYALWNIGFWNVTELKDTIVCFFVTGLWFLFRGINSPNSENALREAVFDVFKIIVIVEFLVNAHTFPLGVELFLFPVFMILGMMQALAKIDPKNAPALKLLQVFQSLLGFLILAFTVWSLAHQIHQMWSADTLKEFALPIVLTLAFLPAPYLVALFSAYEQLFVQLKIGRDKPSSVVRYAKFRLLLVLGFGLSRVHNARDKIAMELRFAISREDIDRALLKLKTPAA